MPSGTPADIWYSPLLAIVAGICQEDSRRSIGPSTAPDPAFASKRASHPRMASASRTAGGSDVSCTSPRRTASSWRQRDRTVVAAELM